LVWIAKKQLVDSLVLRKSRWDSGRLQDMTDKKSKCGENGGMTHVFEKINLKDRLVAGEMVWM
jgi:hypothetical protein